VEKGMRERREPYLDIETSGEGAFASAGKENGADGGVVGESGEDGGEIEPHSERVLVASLHGDEFGGLDMCEIYLHDWKNVDR
jgi:hypothetical protein